MRVWMPLPDRDFDTTEVAVPWKVREFWELQRPVGAICHGVLVLARAGVLGGARTTCLTKSMERSAYLLTAWKLGRYYRTYPAYVQDEVVAALSRPGDFDPGPTT